MRVPPRLAGLVDDGIVQRVLRPLMSGKEAQVYLVEAGGMLQVAKIYKEATERSFKHRADYTEGRRVRGSRNQRAVDKRSRYGREQEEMAWRSAEADMIYKLDDAGVRVPKPYTFVDGVLVMEMIADAHGNPAPRLAEAHVPAEQFPAMFDRLIQEVVKMLCAGVVHGDLSSFNILVEPRGPVIIDFPQAIDAARNANARSILLRDVGNLQRFFYPNRPPQLNRHGQQMWALYERGDLAPDTFISGKFEQAQRQSDPERVLREVHHAEQEARETLVRRPKRGSGYTAPVGERPNERPRRPRRFGP